MPASEAPSAGSGRFQQYFPGAPHHLCRDFPQGPLQHDAAGVEQRDAVADRLHLVEQMRGQQHREAFLLELADHRQQLLRAFGIEADGGLVEDRQHRPLHQDLGEAETLAHAAREAADPVAPRVLQAHAPQCRVHPRLDLCRR